MRNRHIFGIDFPVYQEGRNACVFGFLNRRHRSVRPGVVQNNRRRALGDSRVEQFILPVDIIIVAGYLRVIAQFLRFGFGRLGHRHEKRIVQRSRDDED